MFNIITNELPTEYEEGVRINTDFKQGLKFFNILDAPDLEEEEKAILIMRCLFIDKVPNDPKIWDFISYYIGGGEDKQQGSSGEKMVDFTQDAGRIYAAFRQVYNMNLRNEKMHWWEFLELFKNLPDGTMLSKIIEIRGKKIDPKMDAKTKYNIMKMKNIYALKTNKVFSPML